MNRLSKKSTIIFTLTLLLLTVFLTASTNAFAPYATILASCSNPNSNNNHGSSPIMSNQASLNFINLTPWEIYIGPPNGTNILPNMTVNQFDSLWLRGINSSYSSSGGSEFAFHSIRVPIKSPLTELSTLSKVDQDYNVRGLWCNGTSPPNYSATINYTPSNKDGAGEVPQETYCMYIPITFNSTTGVTSSQTAQINLTITSSNFFYSVNTTDPTTTYYPANALLYGDGFNYNWGFESQAFNPLILNQGSGEQSQTNSQVQFMTISGVSPNPTASGQTTGVWQPFSSGFSACPAQTTQQGVVGMQTFLNLGALKLSEFSNIANITSSGVPSDLVVLIQAGDYADYSVIFLAPPSGTT